MNFGFLKQSRLGVSLSSNPIVEVLRNALRINRLNELWFSRNKYEVHVATIITVSIHPVPIQLTNRVRVGETKVSAVNSRDDAISVTTYVRTRFCILVPTQIQTKLLRLVYRD